MLQFERIIIEDFMSIDRQEFEFENGIHAVVGHNGAGKTQTLLALVQALFNKNPKSGTDKLEETYNKITQKPYTITVYFQKNNDKYVVVNDRKKNKIIIYKNEEDISVKGIKQQLQQIEEIIGMSYNMFISFYYLSTTTIKNIFDVSNEENLIYKFFDIETVKLIDKGLKNKLKQNKAEMQLLYQTKYNYEKQINLLKEFTEIDVVSLTNKKTMLQEALLEIDSSFEAKQIIVLENKLEEFDKKIAELKTEFMQYENTKKFIQKQIKQLESGVCPVCGQSVKGQLGNLEEELEDIKSKQIELKSQKDEIVKEKSKIEEKFEILQSNIEKRKNKIKEELKNIEDKLVFYERDKEKYDKLVEQQNDIEKDLLAVKERIRTLAEENEVIEMMLALIKSNAITHKYLTSFLLLLNNKIKTISSMTGLDVQIFASEIKGKIIFRFEDDGVEKTLNSLSSGEKTRVALVVLFAIFETLQLFTQNKLNILVLDELLGVLDEQGIEMLKTLLEQYRQQMSVFVVLHHNEIEKEFFDLYIKVDKQNGLTQIEVDKVE